MRVIRVEFDSKDGIPANAREEISSELRSHVFERNADTAYLDDWPTRSLKSLSWEHSRSRLFQSDNGCKANGNTA